MFYLKDIAIENSELELQDDEPSGYNERDLHILLSSYVYASPEFHKTMLFHTAGNLLLAFGTRTIAAVQGLGVTMRGHAALWLVGVFFICGMPPSVLFLSELGLVCAAPIWISAVVLGLLFIVFAAMTKVALAMIMGRPARLPDPLPRRLAVVPTLLAAALALGGTACCIVLAR